MTKINALSEETLLLNRYLIKKELGQGGFGRTYLIEDLENNHQKYVLKQFSPSHGEMKLDSKSGHLFKQEAKILAKLNHPQIPQFFNWFEEHNTIFIVQQYIEGDTYCDLLTKKIHNNQLFSEQEIFEWLTDLLEVIDYIHSQKIIHRDISPDNIIYCHQTQKPILIDFGVVKQLIMTVIHGDNSSSKGTIIGKIGYSAPEQLTTGECYPNSDLYALAITSLVLLTGKEPSLLFNSYNREKKWHSYVNISNSFRQILDKMSAEYPCDRYNSAQEVLDDLRAIDSSQLSNENNQLELKRTVSSPPINSSIIPINSEADTLVINQNQNQVNSVTVIKKNKYLYIVFFLVLLGLGGTIIGVASPQIEAICKRLDNCARDKEYQQIYEQIALNGNGVITAYKQVQNLSQLESNQSKFKNIINDLEQIPNDVKIFTQAELKLQEYQKILKEMQIRIANEKKHEQNFNIIVNNIQNLKSKTEAANNISTYKAIKLEWQNLQTQLNSFEQNTFISAQIPEQITKCEENIKHIDSRINSLIAEAKRREAEARLAAQRRALERKKTYTPPPQAKSPTINRTPQNNTIRRKKTTIPKPSPPKPSPSTPAPVSRRGKVW